MQRGDDDCEVTVPAHFFPHFSSKHSTDCAVGQLVLCHRIRNTSLIQPVRVQGKNMLVAWDREHIAAATLCHPGLQGLVAPINAIPGHPRSGHAVGVCPFKHVERQLWLRDQRGIVRNTCFAAARRIIDPFLGNIQRAIQKGPSVTTSIGEKYVDLTVLNAACGAP